MKAPPGPQAQSADTKTGANCFTVRVTVPDQEVSR